MESMMKAVCDFEKISFVGYVSNREEKMNLLDWVHKEHGWYPRCKNSPQKIVEIFRELIKNGIFEWVWEFLLLLDVNPKRCFDPHGYLEMCCNMCLRSSDKLHNVEIVMFYNIMEEGFRFPSYRDNYLKSRCTVIGLPKSVFVDLTNETDRDWTGNSFLIDELRRYTRKKNAGNAERFVPY
jgi:hypothetical protein